MNYLKDIWSDFINPIKRSVKGLPELIGELSVLMTAIFLTVGWIANIVKIFNGDEVVVRIISALIFPIGAFYGFI